MVSPARYHRWLLPLIILLALATAGYVMITRSTIAASGRVSSDIVFGVDRNSYLPGQTIILTLRNAGDQPLILAFDPAYEIWSDETLVYQPIRAISSEDSPARTLKPGESVTWTWDQFTLSGQITSGQYQAIVTATSGQTDHQLEAAFAIE